MQKTILTNPDTQALLLSTVRHCMSTYFNYIWEVLCLYLTNIVYNNDFTLIVDVYFYETFSTLNLI